MRRLVLGLLLATGALAPLATVAPAGADEVVTCQGRATTIVEVGVAEAHGTSGDDVVVTDGSFFGDGGDDLICARSNDRVFVSGGEGDDEIHIEAMGVPAIDSVVSLGPGDDVFEGGPGADEVSAASAREYEDAYQDAAGDDTIRTYGGNDSAPAGAGSVGPAEVDDIDLGVGDDVLESYARSGVGDASTLVGGPGRDVYRQVVPGGRVEYDLAQRRTIMNGRRVASGWGGFEDYLLRHQFVPLPGGGAMKLEALVIKGSSGADRVDLYLPRYREPIPTRIQLGAGDDRLQMFARLRGPVNGGDGRDVLAMLVTSDAGARLDLARGTYTSDAQTRPMLVSRFQDASLYAEQYRLRMYLRGNELANRLSASCGTVRGGPGNDTIRSIADLQGGCAGGQYQGRFYGDRGHDRLVGGREPDYLEGGLGLDAAIGNEDSDRCIAERRFTCERR